MQRKAWTRHDSSRWRMQQRPCALASVSPVDRKQQGRDRNRADLPKLSPRPGCCLFVSCAGSIGMHRCGDPCWGLDVAGRRAVPGNSATTRPQLPKAPANSCSPPNWAGDESRIDATSDQDCGSPRHACSPARAECRTAPWRRQTRRAVAQLSLARCLVLALYRLDVAQ